MKMLHNLINITGYVLSLYKNTKLSVDWSRINDQNMVNFCKNWRIKPTYNLLPASNDSLEFLFRKTIFHFLQVLQETDIDDVSPYIDEFTAILFCYFVLSENIHKMDNETFQCIPHILENKMNNCKYLYNYQNVGDIVYDKLVEILTDKPQLVCLSDIKHTNMRRN